jgi:hypothetical protein
MQVNRKHQNDGGNILYELGFKYAIDYADKPQPQPLVILNYDPYEESTMELLRGVFDAAIRIYLNRFLNIPAATIPKKSATRRSQLLFHPDDGSSM